LRKKYRINRVCMSGGVFQNKYLANNVRPMLEDEGFEVYLHKGLPAHDGNIALGQAVLAGV
jgi:hydrogenase maturation protein HypF